MSSWKFLSSKKSYQQTSYREKEVISLLKDILLKLHLAPNQVKIAFALEPLRSGKILFNLELIAIRVHRLAPFKGLRVECHNQ